MVKHEIRLHPHVFPEPESLVPLFSNNNWMLKEIPTERGTFSVANQEVFLI